VIVKQQVVYRVLAKTGIGHNQEFSAFLFLSKIPTIIAPVKYCPVACGGNKDDRESIGPSNY
jgi:hypothetical protein